ncbi:MULTISPECIES: nucleotide exchange factor GrpE [Oleiagrimonas]|uniref:Protein GrpE n=1 Tax=Oleiagrimonas citrea TaxID=1665687 RepID=A0A846ZMQ2_9GAMM|nr:MULTISPECIES: nucleotide exchange factor GrpE [Oleiagrimonas]NKZ39256.1 nucleotide exchange factor GrpE [Oleiagrimonas citrea]RAP58069.1 nucleotide exchange factor GrpE [Oleiagrimonas sp. MCCC 1A03011]
MEDTKPNAPDTAPDQEPSSTSQDGETSMQELETLTAQLAEAERSVADMRDTLLRERAEIENQRRRLQRELEQARRFANERVLSDLLPVCDSLEQGLAVQTEEVAPLREGMQLTLKSLLKVAEQNGLKAIDPLHKPFDPEQHQAMNMVETDQHAPDTVVAVLQKGYVLNDRLLRPALVAVAKAPSA